MGGAPWATGAVRDCFEAALTTVYCAAAPRGFPSCGAGATQSCYVKSGDTWYMYETWQDSQAAGYSACSFSFISKTWCGQDKTVGSGPP